MSKYSVSTVSRDSFAAREAALKLKCAKEGYELVEVSYYYKNGKKKKRVKKKKIPKKHPPGLPKLKKETLCNAEITQDTMRLPTIPKSFIGAEQPIQERPNGIR